MKLSEESAKDYRTYVLFGQVLQAIVLGSFLIVAVIELFGLSTGAQLFRYEGF